MRLSKNQKIALRVLLAVRNKGNKNPVTVTWLLSVINNMLPSLVASSNFRAGMHRLHDHGLVVLSYNRQLKLLAVLTEKGHQQAIEIEAAMEKESE